MANFTSRSSATDLDVISNVSPRPKRSCRRKIIRRGTRAIAVAGALAANGASASFLSGEALDTAANVVAWVALLLVPIIGIVVFWIVHVMPEKIAHKRHHPQTQAIQTLCLLSLVFGGLLWPIAWLWAYTKPVAYKVAYGTDKHPDSVGDGGDIPEDEATKVMTLRQRIARLEARVPAKDLEVLRADLDALEARYAPYEAR